MKHGRWVLSVAVLALLVLTAVRRVDWGRTAAIIGGAAFTPLVVATLVNALSLVLHGARWWIFLRRIGVRSLGTAVRGAVVGAGLNNLLVVSGGDAARIMLVARSAGVWPNAVLATAALDRIFDPICFLLLVFAATFMMPLPYTPASTRSIAAIALVAVAFVLVVMVRAPERAIPTDARGWRLHLVAFRRHVAALSSAPRFTAALLLSIVIWGTQLATFILAARAVHVDLPAAAAVGALLLTNAGLLVRATPGNVGLFQFAYAVAVRPFGIATESAIAAALLLQLVQIVPVTMAAFVLAPGMWRGGRAAKDE